MTEKSMTQAFVEAYAELSNPKKNAANPAFRSRYANLEELLNVTRPVLAACGFAIVQEPINDGETIGVRTKLVHASGEGMDFGGFTVPITKHDAQGAGSAITYCRRYALAAIFGLAQEDDDGNAASQPKPQAEVKTKAKAAPDGFDILMASAETNNTKGAVGEFLGSPNTIKAAREAYAALTDAKKAIIAAIAAGAEVEG